MPVQNVAVQNGADCLASGIATCSFFSNGSNNFTPDTTLPWTLSNAPTKCEVDWMNHCWEKLRQKDSFLCSKTWKCWDIDYNSRAYIDKTKQRLLGYWKISFPPFAYSNFLKQSMDWKLTIDNVFLFTALWNCLTKKTNVKCNNAIPTKAA